MEPSGMLASPMKVTPMVHSVGVVCAVGVGLTVGLPSGVAVGETGTSGVVDAETVTRTAFSTETELRPALSNTLTVSMTGPSWSGVQI